MDSFCYDKITRNNIQQQSKPKIYWTNKWVTQYKKYLEWLAAKPDNPYRDPDSVTTKVKEYYEELAEFLNKQEGKVLNKQEDKDKESHKKWNYKFIYEDKNNEDYKNVYGIAVFEKEANDETLLFFLKSDQLGFSAPDGNHIYDVYLENMATQGCTDKATNEIICWILSTRTLGGGFLWPMEKKGDGTWNTNPDINSKRGGSKLRRESYIEDRVDLTLWEIKHYFDSKKKRLF
jgi:hypothetical protein